MNLEEVLPRLEENFKGKKVYSLKKALYGLNSFLEC